MKNNNCVYSMTQVLYHVNFMLLLIAYFVKRLV